jgi:uncharacterized protein
VVELGLFSVSVFAGFIGALLGLGGGVVLIPALTLGLGVHIRYAIAASLISIIATSSVGAKKFLLHGMVNLRLAVFLETATVAGALTGFFVMGFMHPSGLYFLFSFVMLFSAVLVARPRHDSAHVQNHSWAVALRIAGSGPQSYGIAGLPGGWLILYIAGVLSALLGIGSGIFKVLAMDVLMKLPLKVSTATSNLMIGVTAAASAGGFLMRGDVRPEIAVPVSLGVLLGAWLGAKAMLALPVARIRSVFLVVLIVVAFQMFWRGLQS